MISRLILLLSISLSVATASASEYIESFHSEIEVRQNGDLYVTETILVNAEGKSIRRGIYRDFPTRYPKAGGAETVVGFEVLSVHRNGRVEPYHLKSRSNGERLYIGDANTLIEHGLHEYRIAYLTTRQLGFFDNFDELYWNVTGTGWTFAIHRASARVSLPQAVPELRLTGYTGRQGSRAQDLVSRDLGGGRAYFETSRRLASNEGLTIVVAWPKGMIDEPSAAQRRAWFIADHMASLVIVGGALGMLALYLLLWHWLGRDPEAGVIVPLYRPPRGYSPASLRYVERMGYDKQCFTCAVVNLAVKGAVQIEDKGGEFRIRSLGKPREAPAPGEKQVMLGLFSGADEVAIKRSNHALLSKAIVNHEKALENDYAKNYFRTNSWLLIPAIAASIALVVMAASYLPSEEIIFKTVFLGIFTLMPLFGVFSVLRAILRRGRKGFVRWGIFLVPTMAFMVVFYASFPIGDFADQASIPFLAGSASMLLLHVLFYHWLKTPTLAGRRLLDEIEGFKHYLEVAEEDEIALENAPTFTTDLYEAYLPYAIALDLENQWTARLDRAIASGLVKRGYSHPDWYRGRVHHGGHFSSALAGSLNSAIASSSVAPGSSSGSSGGSSGGGGGGGGGGGW